jgi:diguanylate cyclase (GGDEF)-like protein
MGHPEGRISRPMGKEQRPLRSGLCGVYGWHAPCTIQVYAAGELLPHTSAKREAMDEVQNIPKLSEDHIVSDSLRVIARFTRVRRAHLAFLNQDWGKMKTIFSWPEGAGDGDSGEQGSMAAAPDLWMQSGWWVQQLRQKNFLKFSNLRGLPAEVQADVDRLHGEGVEAFSLMAVYDGKRLAGILRLDNPPRDHAMHGADVDLLQIASTLILQVVRASVDLSALRSDNARLSFGYWHDERTGLPNRLMFAERLREVFLRKGRVFGVLLVDLECFSLIQHRYGNDISQRLFQMALDRIQAGLRASDYTARLDDDRIGILLVDLFEHDYAQAVAQRILDVFRTPFRLNGKDIGLTACIGAAFPDPGVTLPEVVLQEAEIALRQARRSGKERFMAFDEAMRKRLVERLELENDLRGSLTMDHLVLHYQPITSLETSGVIGFEALVRWKHPTRGLIWPIEFIRLSEDTGLIIPLGEWVLREACRQMRVWQETFRTDPPLVVSVNISALQLEQGDFPLRLADILADTGLPAKCLRLEITESVVVENSCEMLACLDQLRAMGVQLYIDDFGTGYSSLGYLDSLPADAIKIDRTFVNNLGRVKTSHGVIQAIIQLAHELNIGVVAEGVETSEQHAALKNLHCEFAQGFYVSEPLESNDVEKFIRRGDFGPVVSAG